jgi:hypothetical protein
MSPKRIRQTPSSGSIDWDMGFKGQEGGGLGDEELGGGPPAAGPDEGGPIGVPEDYRVDVPEDSPVIARGEVPGSTRSVGPQYYEGDEWEPAGLSPTSIRDIQQAMFEAGLLDSGFRIGVWDGVSAGAYADVLAYANAAGISAQQALVRMAATGEFNPEEAPPPLVVQRTNPEDLRRVFRATIINELGQGWSQEQINRMVASYHQAEEAAYRQEREMQVEGRSGSFNAPPSPEAFAEAEAMRVDPTGVGAHDLIADYVPTFMQLVASPAWGVGG